MTEIRSATPELLALAAAMRPDWDQAALSGALVAAHNSGWTWSRTLACVAALLGDEDATPRDLTAACRQPLDRQASAPPTAEWLAATAAIKAGGDR